MEHRFRQHYLQRDANQNIIGIVLLFIPVIFFIYSDYILWQNSSQFYSLLAWRLSFIPINLILIVILKRIRNEKIFDYSLFAWCLYATSFIFYVNSTRPPGYLLYLLIDSLILMALYIFFMNRFFLQVTAALVFTIGEIMIIFVMKDAPSAMTVNVVMGTLAMTNTCGAFASWIIHTTRRNEFRAHVIEKKLRVELQEAMENVNQLSGLLPICSSCKKIRDDRGYWTQIEAYIRNHSEVDFSHSICPDCAKQFLADDGEEP